MHLWHWCNVCSLFANQTSWKSIGQSMMSMKRKSAGGFATLWCTLLKHRIGSWSWKYLLRKAGTSTRRQFLSRLGSVDILSAGKTTCGNLRNSARSADTSQTIPLSCRHAFLQTHQKSAREVQVRRKQTPVASKKASKHPKALSSGAATVSSIQEVELLERWWRQIAWWLLFVRIPPCKSQTSRNIYCVLCNLPGLICTQVKESKTCCWRKNTALENKTKNLGSCQPRDTTISMGFGVPAMEPSLQIAQDTWRREEDLDAMPATKETKHKN